MFKGFRDFIMRGNVVDLAVVEVYRCCFQSNRQFHGGRRADSANRGEIWPARFFRHYYWPGFPGQIHQCHC